MCCLKDTESTTITLNTWVWFCHSLLYQHYMTRDTHKASLYFVGSNGNANVEYVSWPFSFILMTSKLAEGRTSHSWVSPFCQKEAQPFSGPAYWMQTQIARILGLNTRLCQLKRERSMVPMPGCIKDRSKSRTKRHASKKHRYFWQEKCRFPFLF